MTGASDGSDLLIVIVNYRTGPLVIDCLTSLASQVADHPGTRVTIVDNASDDESATMIEAAITMRGWAAWAGVRRSPVNGGFAYGNNFAIRPAINGRGGATGRPSERHDLFWLLNPDTIVRPGSIAAILAFFANHPLVGVIGTAIDDDTGTRWPFAFRFHSLRGELESALRLSLATKLLGKHSAVQPVSDRAERVDWVSGASTVIRRAVIEGVGLFDEDYFLYFEETDYFRGVARTGWECWYVPDAAVMHISGQSTGLTGKGAEQRRVPPYWFASRRRYLVKNHGRSYAIAADLITIMGLCLWRARCFAMARPHGGSPHFLRDFLWRSAMVRRNIQANDRLTERRPDHSTSEKKTRLPLRVRDA